MAKRDVQLDIQVNGTDQLNNVNDALKESNINAEELAESTLKLSKGIAGGFELAAQAASVFGEETGEAFEKTIARATQYIALSNALKDVAEGFSKKNIQGLTGIVQGFTKAGIGAKLFGTTARTALVSTGIGALVVAIGLLIANWETVKEKVLEFKEALIFISPPLYAIIKGFEALTEKFGSFSNLLKGVGGFIKGLFTAGADAVEEFNKAVEKGKAVDALREQGDLVKEQNTNRERQIKLLEAQGNQQLKILEIQKQSAQLELDNLKQRQAIGDELSKEEQARIEDLNLELQLIDIRTQKALDAEKKAAADAAEKRKKEAEERKKKADAELKAKQKEEEDKKKLEEEALKERLKREQEAAEKIAQLKIDNLKDGAAKEIAQVNLDAQERAKVVTGNDQQIAEQRILIEENRLKKIAEINKKYDDEAKKAQEEAAEEKKKKDEEEAEELAEKRQEEFDTILEYTELAADALDQIASTFTDTIARNIEGLQTQIDAVNQQFNESVANRMALTQELETADGARRDQILADLDKEKQKSAELAAQSKKLQNDKIKAQNKANQIEYANSVIQSVILTARAVLSALATTPPASFALAAITAALAAVQTGIVIANKPKEIPLLATGGFTEAVGGKDKTGWRVAGVVHEGEYVVPNRVLQSDNGSRMVAALEAMRTGKPGFAEGGFSTSTPNIDSPDASFGASILTTALQNLKLAVAVTEVNEVQGRVNAIETRAGI